MKSLNFTMMKKLCLLAVLLPAPAFAAGPDHLRYDYIDLDLIIGEVDAVGDDVDFFGVGAAGSWGFHENIALFASIGAGEIDTDFGDVDTVEFSVGINPHFSITEKVDLVIPVALEYADFDAGFFSDDDTGYSIGIGVRALLNPAWELGVGVQHVDIFDGDEQSLVGNVRWHMSDLFSMAVGASVSDDSSALDLGVRFSF